LPYNNSFFDANRYTNASFNTSFASFVELRAYFKSAMDALKNAGPQSGGAALRSRIKEALRVSEPSSQGLRPSLPPWSNPREKVTCAGGVSIQFDASGSVASFVTPSGTWAGPDHTLGLFSYSTHSEGPAELYCTRPFSNIWRHYSVWKWI